MTKLVWHRHSCRCLCPTRSTHLETAPARILCSRASYALGLLLFAAALLFLAVIGCRNSAKTASPSPTPSPTPATRNVPSSPPVAAPAQTEVVPGPPIQVTPPASFSANQLPQGRVEFAVAGKAGQVLLVKASEVAGAQYNYGTDTRYSVSVQLAATGSSALKALQEGGTCTDVSLYALPQTGTYRVVFDPLPGERHGVDFNGIAKDDPVVDPGLKPEQISIDFGGLAKGEQVHVEPPVLAEGCLDDSGPALLKVHGRGIGVRIMQVAGYKKVFPSDKGIAILEAALAAGKTDSVGELPYASSGDVGLDMWARQKVLEGDGWRGLRWIGGYGQDDSCGPSELLYVFEGITNDGRFLIVSSGGISHPAKQQRWAPRGCVSDAEVPKINALLAQDLTAADPASFIPNLDQLDAVIKSLKLKR